jgi:hypothetical protein
MSNNYIGGVAYTGTRSDNPPNWIMSDRAPTIYDINARIGDLWMDRTLGNAFMLISLDGTPASKGMLATWEPFNTDGIVTVTGDDIIAVTGDIAHNLNVLGAHGINTTGIVAANSETIAIDNTITLGDLALVVGNSLTLTSGDQEITAGDLNVVAGNITLPNTNAAADQGIIQFGGINWIHNYGTDNVFIGAISGNQILTVAARNSGFGRATLQRITTGTDNVGVGDAALSNLTTGTNNYVFGSLSGSNYIGAESSNILINNFGTVGENNTIRVGVSGVGVGEQNRCFVAGINGIIPDDANPVPVLISPLGQLGTGRLPAFYADLLVPKLNATGAGTVVVFNGLNKIFDNNNNLVAATGLFTAPITAKYQFNWQISITNCTIATFVAADLVTTTYTVIANSARCAAGVPALVVNGSALLSMVAGDTAYLNVSSFGEAADTDTLIGGAFSCYLACL